MGGLKMLNPEARLIAYGLIVRIVVDVVSEKPGLLHRLRLAALNEAHHTGSLSVLREILWVLGLND